MQQKGNKIVYVVATPIGNLTDLSSRAIQVLASVAFIACEDTRHTKQMLLQFGINTKLVSLHTHNENDRSLQILNNIPESGSMALVSDAGTPLISDPGFTLINLAIQNNMQVIPIPGACALITALSASGIPANKFCFEGFIPAKCIERRKYLNKLKYETRTMIFYEAPHRILATLQDCIAAFGQERQVAFAREITKQFETIKTTNLSNLYTFVTTDPMQQKGEIVLIISGAPVLNLELSTNDINTLNILLAELTVKQATALAAKITGKSKNLFYEHAIKA